MGHVLRRKLGKAGRSVFLRGLLGCSLLNQAGSPRSPSLLAAGLLPLKSLTAPAYRQAGHGPLRTPNLRIPARLGLCSHPGHEGRTNNPTKRTLAASPLDSSDLGRGSAGTRLREAPPTRSTYGTSPAQKGPFFETTWATRLLHVKTKSTVPRPPRWFSAAASLVPWSL